MADLGTGTTLTFGTSSFTLEVLAINGTAINRAVVNTSHMGTTGNHTKIFGVLVDQGELQISGQYDPDEVPPVGAAVETVTVTYPLPAGQSTPANLAGTAAVTGWDNAVPLEEKMLVNLTITWDGQTGPTLTPSAA